MILEGIERAVLSLVLVGVVWIAIMMFGGGLLFYLSAVVPSLREWMESKNENGFLVGTLVIAVIIVIDGLSLRP